MSTGMEYKSYKNQVEYLRQLSADYQNDRRPNTALDIEEAADTISQLLKDNEVMAAELRTIRDAARKL